MIMMLVICIFFSTIFQCVIDNKSHLENVREIKKKMNISHRLEANGPLGS